MCTAISDGSLFGRTLDLEGSYGEQVTITPRGFTFAFRYEGVIPSRSALIGMAHVCDGVPLYYDAANEAGLCVAALRFAKHTVYHPPRAGRHNLASFEVIPRLLASFETTGEAVAFLKEVTITPDTFSPALPAAPLHWMVADRQGVAAVVESVADGVMIYDNPVGVMANQPPFPYHMARVEEVMGLSAALPENHLCPSVPLPSPLGAGGVGLPGDMTSSARFLRAVFAKYHTRPSAGGEAAVSRFFHVMDTVAQPSGCAVTADGRPVETVYTACMDTETATYYFTTYDCRRIRKVRLTPTDRLLTFPIEHGEDVDALN